MSFSKTKQIEIKNSLEIQQGWYNAVFLRHIEKNVQNITHSYLEFQLEENFIKIICGEQEFVVRLKR